MRNRSYTISEGVLAGLIGFVTVAVVVGSIDLLLGRSLFFTPAVLGRGLVSDPPPSGVVGLAPVIAYNALHLLVFLIIGAGLVQLAHFVELHPSAWYLAFFLCVLAFFIAELAFTVIDPDQEALSWWSIILPTVASAFTMGMFVNARHPKLRDAVEGTHG